MTRIPTEPQAAPGLAQRRADVAALGVRPGARPPGPGAGPLISVVIPTLNCADALARTLDAVAQGGWPDTEIVIADGGSGPETLAVIAANAGRVSRWISAPDSGISEAFNRGVALAQGDIVQITNAGDLPPPGHLARVAAAFAARPDAAIVYGDVTMIDGVGRETRRVRGAPSLKGLAFDSMAAAPHPALAARIGAYETVGLFDENLRFAMDFDWLARALAVGMTTAYAPDLIVAMEEGGASNRNALARDRENLRLTICHGTMPPARAYIRFGLKAAMTLTQRGLERFGLSGASRALRRWIGRRAAPPRREY